MAYRASRSPLTWLGGLLALYLVVPLVAFVVRLAAPGDRGFGVPGLWSAVEVSVVSATITSVLVALFGIPLANWLAKSRGPVAAVTGVLVELPLAIPPVTSGLLLIYLVGPYTTLGQFFHGALTDSLIGVVLAQTFVASPFLIVAARSAFAAIDPALDDLAATLGHRPLARFWRVSLRVAAPGIRAGLLMTWLRAIGEYGATVLLAYHPYTLPVFTYVQFSSTGIPATQAPTALALGIAIVVLLASQLHRPGRWTRKAQLAAPRPPAPAPPTTVSFDLDVMVGSFRLAVAHRAASHRIAILGPSGAGKSITLRAPAGLLWARRRVRCGTAASWSRRSRWKRVTSVTSRRAWRCSRTARSGSSCCSPPAPTPGWPPGGSGPCTSAAFRTACPTSFPGASGSGSAWPGR